MSPIHFLYDVYDEASQSEAQRVARSSAGALELTQDISPAQQLQSSENCDEAALLCGRGLTRDVERYFPSRPVREILIVPHPVDRLLRTFEQPEADSEGWCDAAAFDERAFGEPPDPICRRITEVLDIELRRSAIDDALDGIGTVWWSGTSDSWPSVRPEIWRDNGVGLRPTTATSRDSLAASARSWPSWMNAERTTEVMRYHRADYLIFRAAVGRTRRLRPGPQAPVGP